jgi:hypothetical protein
MSNSQCGEAGAETHKQKLQQHPRRDRVQDRGHVDFLFAKNPIITAGHTPRKPWPITF